MTELKNQTSKQEARMLFKRHKSGMQLSDDEEQLVKKFYPFMR